MCRVTMGHLRVTVGHPRVIMGHLRLSIGYLEANRTELHPKVRQTCFIYIIMIFSGYHVLCSNPRAFSPWIFIRKVWKKEDVDR